ncbi:hypothetical protein NKG05_19830 [Oerskovia sp. M15]
MDPAELGGRRTVVEDVATVSDGTVQSVRVRDGLAYVLEWDRSSAYRVTRYDVVTGEKEGTTDLELQLDDGYEAFSPQQFEVDADGGIYLLDTLMQRRDLVRFEPDGTRSWTTHLPAGDQTEGGVLDLYGMAIWDDVDGGRWSACTRPRAPCTSWGRTASSSARATTSRPGPGAAARRRGRPAVLGLLGRERDRRPDGPRPGRRRGAAPRGHRERQVGVRQAVPVLVRLRGGRRAGSRRRRARCGGGRSRVRARRRGRGPPGRVARRAGRPRGRLHADGRVPSCSTTARTTR